MEGVGMRQWTWKCNSCDRVGCIQSIATPSDVRFLCINAHDLANNSTCFGRVSICEDVDLNAENFEDKIESQVDHPPHYQHPSGVEAITICRHENFNVGNALKYIMRAPNKGNQIQDLNKARWYLADEIERIGGKIEDRT
jgi:hypothetical protein